MTNMRMHAKAQYDKLLTGPLMGSFRLTVKQLIAW